MDKAYLPHRYHGSEYNLLNVEMGEFFKTCDQFFSCQPQWRISLRNISVLYNRLT